MIVKVRLFGRYRETTENDMIAVNVKDGDTIWDVVEELTKKYPNLEKEKRFIMVSLNKTYVTMKTKVKDGDIITLSPPIVGGG